MARNEIDLEDVAALIIFPAAAGMVLGVWTLQLSVFGGYDPAAPFYEPAGLEISVALIVTLASAGWIYLTNEIDGSDYEDWEYGGIIGSFLATPLYVAVPSFATLVDSWDVLALVVWLVIAAATIYISWRE